MADGLVRMLVVVSMLCAGAAIVVGTAGAVIVSDEPVGNSTTMNQSDSLAPVLGNLVDASDPNAHAQARGLTYNDGTVLVVVELEDEAELPAGHNATVEQFYSGAGKTLAEASVPVDQLRGLAAEDTVDYVRPPHEATTMADETEPSTVTTDDRDSTTDETSTDNADRSPSNTDPPDNSDDTLGGWVPIIAAIAVLLTWAGWRTARGGTRA